MNEAIRKAIEGGYGKESKAVISLTGDERVAWYVRDGVLLDPLFWQALGKSRGWKKVRELIFGKKEITEWEYYWHHFIDHLASGKSADEFFTTLLTQKK